MSRFWIILTVVIVALVGIFIVTGKKKDSGGNTFTGDATKVQNDDHTTGNKNAKVTLIEYGDFQCPACGAVYPIMQDLKKKYSNDVLFVFRHFPLISIHANAFAGARAAEAAGMQGKFWEMHDKLYETQSIWGELSTNQQATFEGYAKELGLDVDRFRADYESEAVADRINRDVSSAAQFNAQGTPTFILNGKKIENPTDPAGYEKLLQDAIKESKKN